VTREEQQRQRVTGHTLKAKLRGLDLDLAWGRPVEGFGAKDS
jgi:hypothetical protein